MERKRTCSYDVIRIVAILCVVMIHVSARFVVQFPNGTAAFLLGNVFDSASRIGVPLFLMLSGALLLDETRELSNRKLAKKVGCLALLLVFWSLCYALLFEIIKPLYQGRKPVVSAFFNAWLYGHSHLWYLYMLLGLYLLTPVLRLFVKKANEKYVLYYILLSVLLRFLPFPADTALGNEGILTKLAAQIHGSFFDTNLTYYLLGWYLTNSKPEKKHRLVLYGAGIAGLLYTIVMVQLQTTETYRAYERIYDHGYLNVLTWSVAVFVFLHQKTGDRVSGKIAAQLSDLVFGIYVIHLAVLYFVEWFLTGMEQPFLELPLSFIITLTMSALITAVISKIPLLKRAVRT